MVSTIEDQAQRFDHVIVLENNIGDKVGDNEGKPKKVEPYRHLHYQ
jgi:hypothetical protein